MEFLSNIHLGMVLATMIRELESWSWDKPFCVAMFGFFLVGCIPQFILLRMKWKPWCISLLLGGVLIACDFCCMFLSGMVYDVMTLMETFFISALFGAGLAGAVHIFWEIFRKRGEDEDSPWMLTKKEEEKK